MSIVTEQTGFTLWLTGLSGAGKTTLAKLIDTELKRRGLKSERLDGDVVRQSLTRDLGFSKEDRDKNIERVTFVSKLLSRNGVGVVASFISPYQATRDMVREETTNFIEVFVHAPLEVCIERDVKGLYKKALAGEIENFTGVSDPYEEPENPDIQINTHEEDPEDSLVRVMAYLEEKGFVPVAETL
ncbi:MAG: adenylyl-sulfate kinase [Chloroflexi bacterium]|nr:adenylyl-sulfate kinase [Chloroflexota bacterium]